MSPSTWRGRLRDQFRPDTPAPPVSESSANMKALNRDWRRHTRSHVTGLRPQLDLERDHVRGDAHAAVALLEYGDYASPACRTAHTQVGALLARLGDKVLFAFRNFTIADAHPHALSAATAAEAAGAQGRFWEMHDRIYASEFALDPTATRRFARDLGLDVERFDREIADETYVPRLFEDFNSGVTSGVNGAPTFFINGARLDWDFDAVTLSDALERASS